MPNVTLRDVPEDLHTWLKRLAEAHHRSVNKEVIVLLEGLRAKPSETQRRATVEEIMELSRRSAALPVQDRRGEDEILGYGEDGLPS